MEISLNWPLVAAAVLILVLLRRFSHKKSGLDNLPGPVSASWLTGNFQQLFDPKAWKFHESIAKTYGSTVRIHGPGLYIFDPKAMHTVLIKNQDAFGKIEGLQAMDQLIFGNGLLGTHGRHHRKQRKMLSPVFSAAHMRDMIPTFFEVSSKLEKALKNRLQSCPQIQDIDILSWMSRTALELIGEAGLGYSFDPLTNDESAHPYSRIMKELFPTVLRMQFWIMNVLPFVSRIGSASFRRFMLDLLPWKDAHHLRDMTDYIYNIAGEIFEAKKLALEKGDEVIAQQVGRGKDLISILMRENMKASGEDRLDDDEVLSQIITSTLTFAAMDTTSSAMARLLHLLSKHPEVQEKLRLELNEAKHQKQGHDFSYDELTTLPYLDAVCRETLRLYPPAPIVSRIAIQDVVIPLSKPIAGLDGTEMYEIAVPSGTLIVLSIFNANRNLDLWGKDADEWKPDRWLSPLPEALAEARIPGIYSHLMTFLGGGHSCIGFKFSQLEMKVIISVLVENFQFSPSSKDSEIIWQMTPITAPIVGRDNHAQLPIGISLAIDKGMFTTSESYEYD
ncbi:cytochrome P450 [Gymnopus androsaceus JB14]|uniref:Cytochrome P450 n=1 Tax=Gymnopus androsaceus JB14 TaxID=1447944 RepID=A0A6A4I3T6_9AGAR|nr:cytochrome P450 [Gymnopus androsaceus JB14]